MKVASGVLSSRGHDLVPLCGVVHIFMSASRGGLKITLCGRCILLTAIHILHATSSQVTVDSVTIRHVT